MITKFAKKLEHNLGEFPSSGARELFEVSPAFDYRDSDNLFITKKDFNRLAKNDPKRFNKMLKSLRINEAHTRFSDELGGTGGVSKFVPMLDRKTGLVNPTIVAHNRNNDRVTVGVFKPDQRGIRLRSLYDTTGAEYRKNVEPRSSYDLDPTEAKTNKRFIVVDHVGPKDLAAHKDMNLKSSDRTNIKGYVHPSSIRNRKRIGFNPEYYAFDTEGVYPA